MDLLYIVIFSTNNKEIIIACNAFLIENSDFSCWRSFSYEVKILAVMKLKFLETTV